MGSFQIVDHTADLALRITGVNREDLFLSALEGLIALTEINKASFSTEFENRTIALRGSDDEELLVRFLNEMLDIIQDEKYFPKRILRLDFMNGALSIDIDLVKINEYPESYTEIKATTYHMLEIIEKNGNLTTTIIFDV